MASDSDVDINTNETRRMVAAQNRKKKKSGGFQAMGLSYPIYKGVLRKGYKIPTPIQRKVIPDLLAGRDVVAMARTGSGKTAAFLIPMFERLQRHQTIGIRALILSPTRELAMQTLKFAKELGKFMDLTAAVLLGGDKMEDQFAAIHNRPDILIATPGRLLHVIVEMNLKLTTVEYVVFDEGDRLFEMGFAEQMLETLNRLPDTRQTAIFSATLPGVLVDFARAGLTDPRLVRLDVDNKLSDQLKRAFFLCSADEKLSVLLHLLLKVIPSKQPTVVFLPTKHHVEYMTMVLREAGISCTYVYSDLDPEARQIHTQLFRSAKVDVLLVTDLAARGIDIPELDNVINYNFPGKPKLFLHRVGRVARAGRTGTAYSLISSDELGHLLDLHVFLGRDMSLAERNSSDDEQGLVGRTPKSILDDWAAFITKCNEEKDEIGSILKVSTNAMKKYMKSRPNPSSESIRRIKEMADDLNQAACHPILKKSADTSDEKEDILAKLRAYKCSTTIFEARGRTADPRAFNVMRAKRELHDGIVAKRASQCKKRKLEKESMTEKKKDKEFFIPYQRSDAAAERGLEVRGASAFALEAGAASMDMMDDTVGNVGRNPNPIGFKKHKMWNSKKKKFMGDAGDVKNKKIKTESGVWIPASYQTKKYARWLKQSKAGEMNDDEEGGHNPHLMQRNGKQRGLTVLGTKSRNFHTKNTEDKSAPKGGKGTRAQVKRPEQILKERRRVDKLQKKQHKGKKKGSGKKR